MAIRTQPTLLCDLCQAPIEPDTKVVFISIETFVRVENPAFAPAYEETTDPKEAALHPVCSLDAMAYIVNGVLEDLEAEEETPVFDADTVRAILFDAPSDAAEPEDCDGDHAAICCGNAYCRPCHASNEDLMGTPFQPTVFGVDREEWDSYGRSPYARACGL